MIKVEQIHKSFANKVAVQDVSFSAHSGEIFGLVGPNGAGKTTTMRILYGLIQADSGKVFVDNTPYRYPDSNRLIGALPDGGGLYSRLTARENIAYFGQLHGLSKNQINAKIEQLSDVLLMHDILDRRTKGFSQGERMKVSLARMLVHDPKYIILDEPTNGLDVLTTRAVRNLLLHQKQLNKCIILSSHLMHEIHNLCDRIAIIANGEVKIEGTIEKVMLNANKSNLEDAFVHFAYPEGEHA